MAHHHASGVAVKRKPPALPLKPEPQCFYADSRVERVGDCVCLTFHQTDSGDEVEVWLPLSCAGTAAMSLLEAAFGLRIAERIKQRADYASYRAWLAEGNKPTDWEGLGL